MELQRETGGGNIIRSYRTGELRIRDELFVDHVILTTDTIIADWSPPGIDELSITDLDAALSARPELILLGSGGEQIFPSVHLITEIMQRGIGIEVMDTGAACRTFNVLAAERRRVVAALYLR